SQLGMAIGIVRAGLPGALAAWIGCTLPSALLMIGFAFGVEWLSPGQNAGWLHGLKIVAVAVVAQAVWTMARSLCPDRERATIALLAAGILLLWATAVAQLAAIAMGGLSGWLLLRDEKGPALEPLPVPVGRRAAV